MARVGAQGFEQRVALNTVCGLLGDNERLAHEPSQQVEHVLGGQATIGTDCLGRRKCPPAGEHRQAFKEASLRLAQQLVAPLECRGEGLLARPGRASTAGEETEALIEALGQLVNGERVDPRRGQLQGEWDAIQTAAYLDHGWRILWR